MVLKQSALLRSQSEYCELHKVKEPELFMRLLWVAIVGSIKKAQGVLMAFHPEHKLVESVIKKH